MPFAAGSFINLHRQLSVWSGGCLSDADDISSPRVPSAATTEACEPILQFIDPRQFIGTLRRPQRQNHGARIAQETIMELGIFTFVNPSGNILCNVRPRECWVSLINASRCSPCCSATDSSQYVVNSLSSNQQVRTPCRQQLSLLGMHSNTASVQQPRLKRASGPFRPNHARIPYQPLEY